MKKTIGPVGLLGVATTAAVLANLMLLALPSTLLDLLSPIEARAEGTPVDSMVGAAWPGSSGWVTPAGCTPAEAPLSCGEQPMTLAPDRSPGTFMQPVVDVMKVAPPGAAATIDAPPPTDSDHPHAVPAPGDPRHGGEKPQEPLSVPPPQGDLEVAADAGDAAGEIDGPEKERDLEALPSELLDPALIEAVEAESERRFRRIVQVYEGMEPRNAAMAIIPLAEGDLFSAVRTLVAMTPRKAGAVLDEVSSRSPETAARLTAEMLAQSTPAAFVPAR